MDDSVVHPPGLFCSMVQSSGPIRSTTTNRSPSTSSSFSRYVVDIQVFSVSVLRLVLLLERRRCTDVHIRVSSGTGLRQTLQPQRVVSLHVTRHTDVAHICLHMTRICLLRRVTDASSRLNRAPWAKPYCRSSSIIPFARRRRLPRCCLEMSG